MRYLILYEIFFQNTIFINQILAIKYKKNKYKNKYKLFIIAIFYIKILYKIFV